MNNFPKKQTKITWLFVKLTKIFYSFSRKLDFKY